MGTQSTLMPDSTTHQLALEIPTNTFELKTLLTEQNSILPVGSRTSKSPCFKADHLELQLDHFQVLEVMPKQQRVVVGAGVTLRTLLDALNQHQLALPTIGEWSGQTLGGAISTGTHGGSYRYGSLITSVEAITLMDGQGEIREIRREDSEFTYLLPSFGTTGVVLTYELKCEPSVELRLKRRTVPFEQYLNRLLSLVERENAPHFKSSIWLPALDHVVDYEASPIDQFPAEELSGLRKQRETRFNDLAIVLDWFTKRLAWSGRDFDGVSWRGRSAVGLSHLGARLLGSRDYRGAYDEMIAPLTGDASMILKKRARNRTPPEGEFAVSYEVARELLEHLRTLFAKHGWYPDRPIGLRPGASEHGVLSASQGAPCVWVSLFIYPDNPLMKVLPELLMKFNARPHWGKCVFHPLDRIHELYPQWNEFKRYRDELDPQRRFINAFARDLGL